jgi:sugar/nucleoside kinase (ribokinase family)
LLAPAHFDFSATRARIFALGYLMLLDTLDQSDRSGETGAAKVLRAAREAGLKTAVDCVSEPGPRFREVVLAALRETDILFVNEFEIGQVIGREVAADQDAMVGAALELASEGIRSDGQIVLHAATGVVVIRGDGSRVAHGSVLLPDSEIGGATGAGDAFAAGYLLGFHAAAGVEECLRNGVCAAAMSLADPTPSGGMRSQRECLELGDRYGFRDF